MTLCSFVNLGFYGVTYCLGFRDDFKVDIDDVIERIVSLEIRADPRESRLTINEIREAGLTTTHMYVLSFTKNASDPERWVLGFLITMLSATQSALSSD